MTPDNISTILYCAVSVAGGAFLGALRSKLFASKTENWFHWAFYVVSFLTFGTAIFFLIVGYEKFDGEIWVGFSLAIVFSLVLFWFTKKYLNMKTVFDNKELNTIINDFTTKADKDEIKLFGGDLNFFGEHPSDVDKNIQYITLKAQEFKKVFILCVPPKDNKTRVRYGKLYHEIKNLELKYYNPDKADLKIRGRIIEMQGRIKLLVYIKQEEGYETISTDTSKANGLLYDNIWHLTWTMATPPSANEIQEYLKAFHEH